MGSHDLIADFLSDRAFLCFAIGSGIFFGFYGLVMEWWAQEHKEQLLGSPAPRSVLTYAFGIMRLVFQFCFNAAGALTGWGALWLLRWTPFGQYGWKHLVTVIVAFYGVTGNLPHLSDSLRQAVEQLGKQIEKLVGVGGGSGSS